jgi:hypothetical protein
VTTGRIAHCIPFHTAYTQSASAILVAEADMDFPTTFFNMYLLVTVSLAGAIAFSAVPATIRSVRIGWRIAGSLIGLMFGLLMLDVLPDLT